MVRASRRCQITVEFAIPEIGTRLGPYEIVASLGSGGMGDVYRARDPKLGREVAIKILPASFAADPDRLARFEREARVLASLNHPHIAQIYGLEQQAIVMELVDGETLADRIRRGPLRVNDALTLARQIADGLDAAHEKGIVHRDLKPSNIALTRDGTVKILDFGLAKAASSESREVSDAFGVMGLTHSPTMMAPTVTGVLLGTAPYMSPEQARGKVVDKRTDIWAFGCVLYEMLTGRRAFDGETTTDTVAAILEREPDWTPCAASVPVPIVNLLRLCLEKDVKRRLRDIGDVRLDRLSTVIASGAPARFRPAPWLLAATASIAAIAAVLYARAHSAGALPGWASAGASFAIPAPSTPQGLATPSPTLAVSTDGQYIAWLATPPGGRVSMWLYSVASGTMRNVPGTEGAANPFWAPDSHAIGFQAQGFLKTLDIASGSIKSIASNPEVSGGGTWSRDDAIVYSTRYALQHVSVSGGEPRVVATLNAQYQENSLRYPRFLPDGRHFLYVARSGRSGQSGAYLGSLVPSEKPRRLFATTSHVEYAQPGYLVYGEGAELVARSFDARSLAVGKDVVTIVSRFGGADSGMRGHFDVSENGVLAYFTQSTVPQAKLRWFDRAGQPHESGFGVGDISHFRLSPDGRRIAADLRSPQATARDVWVFNPDGGSTRVTFGGSDDWQPFWSPDGRSIAWMSYRNGPSDLFVRTLDSADPEHQLIASSERPNDQKVPGDWSPNGRMIAYWSETSVSLGDVWLQPLDGSKSIPIAVTKFNERRPRFAPDGRFVAYDSDETGQQEVFVQPIPPTGGKWQISIGGGAEVSWRGDGRELYYIDPAGFLVVVPVTISTGTLTSGAPVRLFKIGSALGGNSRYEASQDGQRFLVRETIEPPSQPITVLLNWQAKLASARSQ